MMYAYVYEYVYRYVMYMYMYIWMCICLQITFAYAGYTIQQIKDVGYPAGEILDLRHWYPLEQVKTVYTDQEIEEAGYTTEGERITGTEP